MAQPSVEKLPVLRQVRTKGYYRSVLKSVFGKVPMRLRRVWGGECRGAAQRTVSSMPTGKNLTTPELSEHVRLPGLYAYQREETGRELCGEAQNGW